MPPLRQISSHYMLYARWPQYTEKIVKITADSNTVDQYNTGPAHSAIILSAPLVYSNSYGHGQHLTASVDAGSISPSIVTSSD